MADEEFTGEGPIESFGINLSVDEVGDFNAQLNAAASALDRFSANADLFAKRTENFNASLYATVSTLGMIQGKIGPLRSLSTAMGQMARIPTTTAQVSSAAEQAARSINTMGTALRNIKGDLAEFNQVQRSIANLIESSVTKAVSQAVGRQDSAEFTTLIEGMLVQGLAGVDTNATAAELKDKIVDIADKALQTSQGRTHKTADTGKIIKRLLEDQAPTLAAGLAAAGEAAAGQADRGAGAMAQSFIASFKRHMGIASPSKVMIEQGEAIGQGLVDGLNNMAPAVGTAGTNMGENMFSGFHASALRWIQRTVFDVRDMMKAIASETGELDFSKIDVGGGSAAWEKAQAKKEGQDKSIAAGQTTKAPTQTAARRGVVRSTVPASEGYAGFARASQEVMGVTGRSLVAIDTETTGLRDEDRAFSISAARLSPTGTGVERIEILVKEVPGQFDPAMPADVQSKLLPKYLEARQEGVGLTAAEASQVLRDWLQETGEQIAFAAYNAPFDTKMVNKLPNMMQGQPWIDVLDMVRKIALPTGFDTGERTPAGNVRLKLGDVFKAITGGELEGAHEASADVQAAGEALGWLLENWRDAVIAFVERSSKDALDKAEEIKSKTQEAQQAVATPQAPAQPKPAAPPSPQESMRAVATPQAPASEAPAPVSEDDAFMQRYGTLLANLVNSSSFDHTVRNRTDQVWRNMPQWNQMQFTTRAAGIGGFLASSGADSTEFGHGTRTKYGPSGSEKGYVRSTEFRGPINSARGAMDLTLSSPALQEGLRELEEAGKLNLQSLIESMTDEQLQDAIGYFSPIQGRMPWGYKKMPVPKKYADNADEYEALAKEAGQLIADKLGIQPDDHRAIMSALRRDASGAPGVGETIVRELAQSKGTSKLMQEAGGSITAYLRRQAGTDLRRQKRIEAGNEPYIYADDTSLATGLQKELNASPTLSASIGLLQERDRKLTESYAERVANRQELLKKYLQRGGKEDDREAQRLLAEIRFNEALVNRQDPLVANQLEEISGREQEIVARYAARKADDMHAINQLQSGEAEKGVLARISEVALKSAYERQQAQNKIDQQTRRLTGYMKYPGQNEAEIKRAQQELTRLEDVKRIADENAAAEIAFLESQLERIRSGAALAKIQQDMRLDDEKLAGLLSQIESERRQVESEGIKDPVLRSLATRLRQLQEMPGLEDALSGRLEWMRVARGMFGDEAGVNAAIKRYLGIRQRESIASGDVVSADRAAAAEAIFDMWDNQLKRQEAAIALAVDSEAIRRANALYSTVPEDDVNRPQRRALREAMGYEGEEKQFAIASAAGEASHLIGRIKSLTDEIAMGGASPATKRNLEIAQQRLQEVMVALNGFMRIVSDNVHMLMSEALSGGDAQRIRDLGGALSEQARVAYATPGMSASDVALRNAVPTPGVPGLAEPQPSGFVADRDSWARRTRQYEANVKGLSGSFDSRERWAAYENMAQGASDAIRQYLDSMAPELAADLEAAFYFSDRYGEELAQGLLEYTKEFGAEATARVQALMDKGLDPDAFRARGDEEGYILASLREQYDYYVQMMEAAGHQAIVDSRRVAERSSRNMGRWVTGFTGGQAPTFPDEAQVEGRRSAWLRKRDEEERMTERASLDSGLLTNRGDGGNAVYGERRSLVSDYEQGMAELLDLRHRLGRERNALVREINDLGTGDTANWTDQNFLAQVQEVARRIEAKTEELKAVEERISAVRESRRPRKDNLEVDNPASIYFNRSAPYLKPIGKDESVMLDKQRIAEQSQLYRARQRAAAGRVETPYTEETSTGLRQRVEREIANLADVDRLGAEFSESILQVGERFNDVTRNALRQVAQSFMDADVGPETMQGVMDILGAGSQEELERAYAQATDVVRAIVRLTLDWDEETLQQVNQIAGLDSSKLTSQAINRAVTTSDFSKVAESLFGQNGFVDSYLLNIGNAFANALGQMQAEGVISPETQAEMAAKFALVLGQVRQYADESLRQAEAMLNPDLSEGGLSTPGLNTLQAARDMIEEISRLPLVVGDIVEQAAKELGVTMDVLQREQQLADRRAAPQAAIGGVWAGRVNNISRAVVSDIESSAADDGLKEQYRNLVGSAAQRVGAALNSLVQDTSLTENEITVKARELTRAYLAEVRAIHAQLTQELANVQAAATAGAQGAASIGAQAKTQTMPPPVTAHPSASVGSGAAAGGGAPPGGPPPGGGGGGGGGGPTPSGQGGTFNSNTLEAAIWRAATALLQKIEWHANAMQGFFNNYFKTASVTAAALTPKGGGKTAGAKAKKAGIKDDIRGSIYEDTTAGFRSSAISLQRTVLGATPPESAKWAVQQTRTLAQRMVDDYSQRLANELKGLSPEKALDQRHVLNIAHKWRAAFNAQMSRASGPFKEETLDRQATDAGARWGDQFSRSVAAIDQKLAARRKSIMSSVAPEQVVIDSLHELEAAAAASRAELERLRDTEQSASQFGVAANQVVRGFTGESRRLGEVVTNAARTQPAAGTERAQVRVSDAVGSLGAKLTAALGGGMISAGTEATLRTSLDTIAREFTSDLNDIVANSLNPTVQAREAGRLRRRTETALAGVTASLEQEIAVTKGRTGAQALGDEAVAEAKGVRTGLLNRGQAINKFSATQLTPQSLADVTAKTQALIDQLEADIAAAVSAGLSGSDAAKAIADAKATFEKEMEQYVAVIDKAAGKDQFLDYKKYGARGAELARTADKAYLTLPGKIANAAAEYNLDPATVAALTDRVKTAVENVFFRLDEAVAAGMSPGDIANSATGWRNELNTITENVKIDLAAVVEDKKRELAIEKDAAQKKAAADRAIAQAAEDQEKAAHDITARIQKALQTEAIALTKANGEWDDLKASLDTLYAGGDTTMVLSDRFRTQRAEIERTQQELMLAARAAAQGDDDIAFKETIFALRELGKKANTYQAELRKSMRMVTREGGYDDLKAAAVDYRGARWKRTEQGLIDSGIDPKQARRMTDKIGQEYRQHWVNIDRDLAGLRQATLAGNEVAFKQYADRLKTELAKTDAEVSRTARKIEERIAKIDKQVASKEKWDKVAADPRAYLQEKLISSAKGTGIGGWLSRKQVTAQETIAAAAAQKEILKYQVSGIRRFFGLLWSPVKYTANAAAASAAIAKGGADKAAKAVAPKMKEYGNATPAFAAYTSSSRSRVAQQYEERANTYLMQMYEQAYAGGKSMEVKLGKSVGLSYKKIARGYEQGAMDLTQSQARKVVQLAEREGVSAGMAMSRGMEKGAQGGAKKTTGLFNKFKGDVGTGIGLGFGMSFAHGIINAIQSMAWRIQSTISGIFREGFTAAMEMEMTQVSFTAMSAREQSEATGKSTAEVWEQANDMAAEQLDMINKMAKVSSFGRTPLIEGYKGLRAAEYTESDARALMQTITNWSDVYAPGQQQVLDTFATQLGQMRTTGILQMQDLKPLQQTANIPVLRYIAQFYQEISDDTGEATGELRYANQYMENKTEALKQIADDMSAGKIGATATVRAIVEGLQKDTEGMEGKGAKTLTGLLSTFGDIRQQRMENFVTPLMEGGLKPFLDWINEMADSPAAIEAFKTAGEQAFTVIAGAMEGLVAVLGTLKGLWESLPEGIQDLIKWAGATAAILGGITLVLTAISVVGPTVAAMFAGMGGQISLITVAFSGFLAFLGKSFPEQMASLSEMIVSPWETASQKVEKEKEKLTIADAFVQDEQKRKREDLFPSLKVETGPREQKWASSAFLPLDRTASPNTFKELNSPWAKQDIPRTYNKTIGPLTEQQLETEVKAYGDWRDNVINAVSDVVEGVTGKFNEITGGISGMAGTISEWWYGIIEQISSNFVGFLDGIYQNVSGYFGNFIDFLNTNIIPGIQGFVQGFSDGLANIPQVLSDLTETVWQWGQDLINVFVDAFYAASSAFVQFFGWLGDLFAEWLQPQSPPKFIPDLENWGTGAADVWLQGWTKVDFSTMKTLTGKLEEALQLDEGTLEESQISAIRKGVAATIDAATKGIATNSFVLDAIPGWGGRAEQVARLTQAYAQLAVVQHKSAVEQEYLDQVTTQYDALLKPLENRLKSFQDQQEKMDLTDQIKEYERVISNVYATDKQREAAQLKLDELTLQQKINDIEMERNAITDPINERLAKLAVEEAQAQKILDITEARWDTEVDMMRAGQQKTGDAGGAEDAAAKEKDEKEGKDRQFTAPNLNLPPVKMPEGMSKIGERLQQWADDVKKKFEPVTKAVGDMGEALSTVTGQVGPLVEAFNQGVTSGVLVQDGTIVGFFNNMGVAADTTATAIGSVVTKLGELWESLSRSWTFGPFAGSVDTKEVTDPSGNKMKITVPSAQAQEWASNAGFNERVQAVMAEIGRQIQLGLDAIQAKALLWYAEFKAWWNAQDWTALRTNFANAMDTVRTKVQEATTAIFGFFGIQPGDDAMTIDEKVSDKAFESGEAIQGIAGGFLAWLAESLAEQDWGAVAETAVLSIPVIAEKILAWIAGAIKGLNLVAIAKPAGHALGEALAGAIAGAMKGLAYTIVKIPSIAEMLGQVAVEIVNAVIEALVSAAGGLTGAETDPDKRIQPAVETTRDTMLTSGGMEMLEPASVMKTTTAVERSVAAINEAGGQATPAVKGPNADKGPFGWGTYRDAVGWLWDILPLPDSARQSAAKSEFAVLPDMPTPTINTDWWGNVGSWFTGGGRGIEGEMDYSQSIAGMLSSMGLKVDKEFQEILANYAPEDPGMLAKPYLDASFEWIDGDEARGRYFLMGTALRLGMDENMASSIADKATAGDLKSKQAIADFLLNNFGPAGMSFYEDYLNPFAPQVVVDEAIAAMTAVPPEEKFDAAKKTFSDLGFSVSDEYIQSLVDNVATVNPVEAIGRPIGEGVIEGVGNAINDPKTATMWDDFVTNTKKFFGIESPSKLMSEFIGQPIGLGIVEGIKIGMGLTSGEGTSTATTSPLAQFFTNAMAETTAFKLNLAVAFLNMKTAITGILNTANLEWQAKLLEGYGLLNTDFDAFAVDWVEVRWPAMTQALIDLLDAFKQSSIDKIKEMAKGVLDEVNNLVQQLTSEDMIAKWNDAGADIGRGLVDGMIDSFGDEKTDEKLKKGGEALINAVVAALKAAGLMDSPSRLTRDEVGVYLAEGVAEGVAQGGSSVRQAAETLVDNAIVGANQRMRKAASATAAPLDSMRSNTAAVQSGRVENHFHMHLTTTPQVAAQAGYNFAVMEVMAS